MAQNCAARLITRTSRREHVTPILFRLHWLPVYQRVTFKTLCIVFRCLHHDNMPVYLSSLFQHNPARQLRSSSGTQLALQRSRNSHGERSFGTNAARLWNSLPQNIQDASSLLCFKKLLKTVLFVQHYNL